MKVRDINGLTERKRDGIFEHVFSNKDREVAGVLIGEHFEDGSLWIAHHIPAEEADEQAAAVTFTHESWDRILKIKDTDFADLEIVGWYHSHPGYGLFLSNDDMFLHRNFFPAWWQIAYVVDPINEEGGIFVWQESDEESEQEPDMEMFEKHEATFGTSGAAALLAKGSDSLPIPPVREKLPEKLLPEGVLGFALAVAGVFVLVVILGFVLLGSGGSDEDAATVLPVEPTAAPPPPDEKESEKVEDQFPSKVKKETYVPVAPPAAPSKGSSPSSAGSAGSAPAPAPSPPPSSGGGGSGGSGGGGVRPGQG